ncbi:MAG: hypothetical protein IJX99_00090 [Clostridia bacterium]|nr:hypothetical protein [Clostridia bacterium]
MVRKLMRFVFLLIVIFLLHEKVLEAEEIPEFYQVICQEPNGSNGYYKSAPEVIIKHFDGKFVTRYQILFPDGKKLTGRIADAGKTAVISATVFEEGEHQLDVWMEELNGNMIAGTEQTKKIKIDRIGPDKPILFAFDKERGNVVEIEAEDTVSGVEGIYYRLGNGEVQYLKGAHVYVTVPSEFCGRITAYAIDKAGSIGTAWESEEIGGGDVKTSVRGVMKTLDSKNEYISGLTEQNLVDYTKPKFVLEGIENYMIVGDSVQFSCKVMDDNELLTLNGEIVWEDVTGNKKTMKAIDWSKEGEIYIFRGELKQDGIYRIFFQGEDQAGNQSEEKWQIIIDKTNPIIKKVQELNGAELESFQWDYDMDEIVSDFSTYTYEVRLDGVLCNEKKMYSKAGKHALEVLVTDAAGNQAKAVAEFRIVREQEKQSFYMWKSLLLILGLIILGSVGKVFLIKGRVKKSPIKGRKPENRGYDLLACIMKKFYSASI